MKNNIIVCKTFCFPHPKQRIGVQKIAVDGKGNIRTAGHIIFPYIRTQPAFQPPALIVVGPGAFLLKFISGLKSADKKIPYIFSCFGKIPYQFLKIRHDPVLLWAVYLSVDIISYLLRGRTLSSQLF